MALSWQEQIKPAGTQDIQCDIEYLDKSYIHVYLDGTETTGYTWTSSTNIRLNTALEADTTVLLIRKTEREYLYIEFASGSPFIEANVDSQNTQLLHLAQELVEGRAIPGFYGELSMNGYRITQVGTPEEDTDAANKGYVDSTVAVTQNDVNSKFLRTLRAPESYIGLLPPAAARGGHLLAFNSLGDPTPVLPESGSAADVMLDLASAETGQGSALVMHHNGVTVAEMLDTRAAISVLEFIPTELWQYIGQEVSAADAIAGAGDLYPYIAAADAVAYTTGKALFFPAGQYPISQTYNQTARSVFGVFGASFLVAHPDFPTGAWLHTWGLRDGQPRLSTLNMSYDGLGYSRGDYVGGFLLGTGCHSSAVDGIFARNCWLGGFRINPLGATRDIVNFLIDRVYLLDCGSASHYPGFSIELSSGTSAITDGTIRNIDISGTNADSTATVGPMAFTITTNSKSMFNVVMERFFTSTRLNTHVKTVSNSRYWFTGCVMRQFSGETHAYINGVDTNGYFTALPQVSLQAGYRNRFEQMYAHGALNNAGLEIVDGIEPVFVQWTFQPGQNQDMSGNYLPALSILACDYATFRDCSVRNLISTSYDAPWKHAFTKYMTDNGTGTLWESSQLTSNPTVLQGRDYYSALTLKSGSTTRYYPTNSVFYGADIVFNAADGNLVMGFPATANATDDQSVQFPLLTDPGQGGVSHYYLTAKVTMTAGDVNNWYLAFQMYSTFWTLTPTALGTEYILHARFPVGTSTTLNRLIIHIGHSSAVTSACSFTISEIALSPDRYVYPFKYKKVKQVV